MNLFNEEEEKIEYTADFEEFWSHYPKHKAKIDAQNAFKALMKKKIHPTLRELILIVENERKSRQWQKEGGQFIPHAGRFLRSEDLFELLPDPPPIKELVQGTTNNVRSEKGELRVKFHKSPLEKQRSLLDDAVKNAIKKQRGNPRGLIGGMDNSKVREEVFIIMKGEQ